MDSVNLYILGTMYLIGTVTFYLIYRFSTKAFLINLCLVIIIAIGGCLVFQPLSVLVYLVCPLSLLSTLLFVFIPQSGDPVRLQKQYKVSLRTAQGRIKLDNIRRGVSIIGSAGSGKTESVVYGFLKHFRK